ncbi:hypothetical protein [Rhodococcus sp. HS-D2]|uniref:hypothetical protein n=1 Tax=Rhodococcus sp. HS-D2 TaxID=1384636 RepID=UPI000A48B483|nr:hypothetical protein [Rhodococcus sp. HS-D2]
MRTASRNLCKELFDLSGWDEASLHKHPGPEIENAAPAYDLGFLMRKLPDGYTVLTRFNDGWLASWAERADAADYAVEENTPEDAVAALALLLFEKSILQRY